MQKYVRPFFTYLARRKAARKKQLAWENTQEQTQRMLRQHLADLQEMNAETEHRIPAITGAMKPVVLQPAPYCVLPSLPPPNDAVRVTDPLTQVPQQTLALDPLYIEHDRILHMLRTHVESFVRYYGYIPRAIRVSKKTASVWWRILWKDTYAWNGIEIQLVYDALSPELPDTVVECIHIAGESGRIPATVHAPTTARPTRQLRLSDIQEQQLQGMK